MPKNKTRWSPEPAWLKPIWLEPEGSKLTIPKINDQTQPVIYDHRGVRILPRPIGFKK